KTCATISANLAVAFADSGKSTALVDTDLRTAALTHVLQASPEPGLDMVLAGNASSKDALVQWGRANLALVSTNTVTAFHSEYLGSNAMRDLVDELASLDVVVYHTPSLHLYTDAAVVAQIVGNAVVLASTRSTTRETLTDTMAILSSIGVRFVGVVLI